MGHRLKFLISFFILYTIFVAYIDKKRYYIIIEHTHLDGQLMFLPSSQAKSSEEHTIVLPLSHNIVPTSFLVGQTLKSLTEYSHLYI